MRSCAASGSRHVSRTRRSHLSGRGWIDAAIGAGRSGLSSDGSNAIASDSHTPEAESLNDESPAYAGLSRVRRRGLEPPPGPPGPGPQPCNSGVRCVLCVHIVQGVHGSGRNGRSGRSGCCHGCCRSHCSARAASAPTGALIGVVMALGRESDSPHAASLLEERRKPGQRRAPEQSLRRVHVAKCGRSAIASPVMRTPPCGAR